MAYESTEHEYPPDDWSIDEIATALRSNPAEFPLPTYDNAGVWKSLRSDDLTAPVADSIVERAEEDGGKAVPPLPASLYLEYARTGNRARYEGTMNERSSRLSMFVLAECFEREGEYTDDILDYAWALCEQTTWVLPAHLRKNERQERNGLPGVVPDADRLVALRPVKIAQQLAEIDHILGEQLHPALRERIRHEVDRRIFTPYEERDDFGWLTPPTSNWNAVCNARVGIAALHLLDDPSRQASIIGKAIRSLKHYLSDFDSDGCTAEGISYWNYGFRYYVQLAAHLEQRTDGNYSLLSPPVVEKIAEYPLQVEMSPGHFIPFSDAVEEAHVDPFTACWLGRQYDMPGLAARGRREFDQGHPLGEISDTLRALLEVRHVPADWAVPRPPKRSYFSGYDWWLSRANPDDPDGPVAAAKGGHNDEPHNHNDLGSFVLHTRGESLLTDLGSPVYDADYFGEGRYEYLVARSLGHNVPFVNGTEQRAGEEYGAAVTDIASDEDVDSFSLDIAGAYPDGADLVSLDRTLTLDRTLEQLVIEDDAEFERRDNEFVEVLVSYFPIEGIDDGIRITGEMGSAVITTNPTPATIDVEHLESAVRGDDVWRARLSFHTSTRVTVALTALLE